MFLQQTTSLDINIERRSFLAVAWRLVGEYRDKRAQRHAVYQQNESLWMRDKGAKIDHHGKSPISSKLVSMST